MSSNTKEESGIPAAGAEGPGPGPAGTEGRTPYEADLARADECLRDGRTEEAARIVEGMRGKLQAFCETARRSEAPREHLARVLRQVDDLLQRCISLRQEMEAELRTLRLQERYNQGPGPDPGGSWVSERA
jgi:hypothetical protein